MNKLLPFLAFSILLLVPVGSQNAFAGEAYTICAFIPNELNILLNPGETSEFTGMIFGCSEGFSEPPSLDWDTSDCISKGIGVLVKNLEYIPSQVSGDLTITNINNLEASTCQITYSPSPDVFREHYEVVNNLNIIVQTSVNTEIGGTLLDIQTTSLLLAGMQSVSWIFSILLSVAGIGLYLVFKRKND